MPSALAKRIAAMSNELVDFYLANRVEPTDVVFVLLDSRGNEMGRWVATRPDPSSTRGSLAKTIRQSAGDRPLVLVHLEQGRWACSGAIVISQAEYDPMPPLRLRPPAKRTS